MLRWIGVCDVLFWLTEIQACSGRFDVCGFSCASNGSRSWSRRRDRGLDDLCGEPKRDSFGLEGRSLWTASRLRFHDRARHREASYPPRESRRAFDDRKRHHRQSELERNPNSGMDLEGDHSPDGRRLTAERNHRYGSPTLRRMATVSRAPSLPDYWTCLVLDE